MSGGGGAGGGGEGQGMGPEDRSGKEGRAQILFLAVRKREVIASIS